MPATPPASASFDEVPAALREKYAFIRWLGHGGMCSVYLGRHATLNHQVVVKVLSRSEPDYEERFLREARVLASLRHPYIGPLLDFGKVGERTYLTSAYEAGYSLAAILEEEGRLPWRRVAEIGRMIAAALAEVHGQAIVHRDVKPGNIIVAADGTAKLIDFGFSRLPDSTLTAAGEYLGTPSYSAPEHCHSGTCNARTDLYSLGVVLYEALAGRNPFRGGTAADELKRQLSLRVVEFPGEAEPIPDPLRRVVLSMLQKSAGDRPASAARVEETLATLLKAGEAALETSRQPRGTPAARDAEAPGRDRGLLRQELLEKLRRGDFPDRRRGVPPHFWTGFGLLGGLALAGLGAWAARTGVPGTGARPLPLAPAAFSAPGPAVGARAGGLPGSSLRFVLSPAGRVVSVEVELDEPASARLEEDERPPVEWTLPQRSHRLHRDLVSPARRFRVAFQWASGEDHRTHSVHVEAGDAVAEASPSGAELESFAAGMRRASCETRGLLPAAAERRVLRELEASPLAMRLPRVRPYLTTPASLSCRFSLAGRRRLLHLKAACLELWRAARFLEAAGAESGAVRGLAPPALWPEPVGGTAGVVLATASCPPDGGWRPFAEPQGDCPGQPPPIPLASCAVELHVTAAARLAVEVDVEYSSPHRFTRLDVSGIAPEDGARVVESLLLPAETARRVAPLDAAFLTCRRLELILSPEWSPSRAGSPQPASVRLGPSRVLALSDASAAATRGQR